jgi:hypothetical protein
MYTGVPAHIRQNGKQYTYTYLDLRSHVGIGENASSATPASRRYLSPAIFAYVPLPPGVGHCTPVLHATEDVYVVADGRHCWTHYKPGFGGTDPNTHPAHWVLTIKYRNILVSWDFPGHGKRHIPPGVFAFDDLMEQLLAAH